MELMEEREAVSQPAPTVHGRIRPDWTLSEILGNGYFFNPRPSFSNPGWMRLEPEILDFLTGAHFSFAGDMPVLCSRSMVDPRALRLLETSGLELGSHLVVYDDAKSYLDLLRKDNRKWVVQHIHPEDEILPAQYWIPRDLLARLNNKSHLARFVTAACVPDRRLAASAREIDRSRLSFPVVVKVASDETSGGGFAVRICKDEAAFGEALIALGEDRELVLESFLNIRRNLCIQFAVLQDGTVSYLGSSEQVIDKHGGYYGNWIDPDTTPSPAAKLACRLVTERAAQAGYRGIAGYDTAELKDGRVFVFDLNFRINGSTPPLLLYGSLQERFGKPVLRSRNWRFEGPYRQMLEHVERWSDEGKFIPFTLQRPRTDGETPRTSGVLMGGNRAEVGLLVRQWMELGFA